MCLIFLAYRAVAGLPLAVAANRDEYYDRPTAALDFWDDAPHILAGRDRQAGGTWMGVNRAGRFAALTNFRGPGPVKDDAPSRGALVAGFLDGGEPIEAFKTRLKAEGCRYNGYNLIFGTPRALFWHSNTANRLEAITPGVHGLSNGLFDEPWPKVHRGVARLRALPATSESWSADALFAVLADRTVAADDALPDTGVGLPLERILSPAFIRAERYGARSGTALRLDAGGRVAIEERTYQRDPGVFTARRRSLDIDLANLE